MSPKWRGPLCAEVVTWRENRRRAAARRTAEKAKQAKKKKEEKERRERERELAHEARREQCAAAAKPAAKPAAKRYPPGRDAKLWEERRRRGTRGEDTSHANPGEGKRERVGGNWEGTGWGRGAVAILA